MAMAIAIAMAVATATAMAMAVATETTKPTRDHLLESITQEHPKPATLHNSWRNPSYSILLRTFLRASIAQR